MTDGCRIEMLGRYRIQHHRRVITRFSTYKTGALLAYLALKPNTPHPREYLIDLLWPECTPNAGRHSLSQALSSLRHQLEPPGVQTSTYLIADREHICLNAESLTIDVAEFNARIQHGPKDESGTSSLLAMAVDLYNGELLPGYYEDWIIVERERLQERYLDALSRLIKSAERFGELNAAIEYAQRGIKVDPLRSDFQAAVIRRFVAGGNPDKAIKHFKTYTKALKAELGIGPGPEVTAAISPILRPVSEDTDQIAVPTPASALEQRPLHPEPAVKNVGAVTFLLTSIGNLSRATVDTILAESGGKVIPGDADLISAVFTRSASAYTGALELQRQSLQLAPDSSAGLRIALHTGELPARSSQDIASSEPSRGRETGIHYARRLWLAARTGQILCSEAFAVMLKLAMPQGASLVDLGLYLLDPAYSESRLYDIDYPDRMDKPRDLESGPVQRGALPAAVNRFFGREQELTRLTDLIGLRHAFDGVKDRDAEAQQNNRLATLVGPGGTGKTRLALEAARQVESGYRGAVWYVPLADLGDPSLIGTRIAGAMGIAASSRNPLQQVAAALSRQPSLLILDNLEQLVSSTNSGTASQSDAASAVSFLLQNSRNLACLATSRRALGVMGETALQVHPLPVPTNGHSTKPDSPLALETLMQVPSVRLFIDRAQAVRTDFQLKPSNAEAVTALCTRLEGIPLAIELAAARSQVMTPTQLLSKIGRRFDLLQSRRRDIEDRHRTLQGAIDWSFRLLYPEAQQLFAALSVFRGGWSTESAETICADPDHPTDILDLLAELSESSLITCEETTDGEMRFAMLESLREYAESKLSNAETVRLSIRHAEYYGLFAKSSAPELMGRDQQTVLRRMQLEHGNFLVAVDRMVDSASGSSGDRLGAVLAQTLVASLWRYWEISGHFAEGRARIAAVLQLENSDKESSTRFSAMVGAGALAIRQGDYADAKHWWNILAVETEAAGNFRILATALNGLGMSTWYLGDSPAARQLLGRAVELARKHAGSEGIASAIGNLAEILTRDGDWREARELMEEAISLHRQVENHHAVALRLNSIGQIAILEGKPREAQTILEEAISLTREMDYGWGSGHLLHTLGWALFDQGKFNESISSLRESLTVREDIGDAAGIAHCLEWIAIVDAAEGRSERAAALFGASQIQREIAGSPLPPSEEPKVRAAEGTAVSQLGDAEYLVHLAKGKAMTLEQAADLAMREDL